MRPVIVNQNFNAAPELVFDAWLKPEIIKKWLFKSETNHISEVHIDLRIGGDFSILEITEHCDKIDHFGQYQQIDKPNLLAFTLEVPRHFAGKTCVTIKIRPLPQGCTLTFMQTGVVPEIVEANWIQMLQQLKFVIDGEY